MTEQEFMTKFNELIKQKPKSIALIAVAQLEQERCKIVVDGGFKSLVAGVITGLLKEECFAEVIFDSIKCSVLLNQYRKRKQRGC